MKFEWDPHKNEVNIKKHGIDFSDLEPFFEQWIWEIQDDRFHYGEIR